MKGITNSVPKGVRIVQETFTTIVTTDITRTWINVDEHGDTISRLITIAQAGRMIKWDATKNNYHLGTIQATNLNGLMLYSHQANNSITPVYFEYDTSTSRWRFYLGANYTHINGTYVFRFWYYGE